LPWSDGFLVRDENGILQHLVGERAMMIGNPLAEPQLHIYMNEQRYTRTDVLGGDLIGKLSNRLSFRSAANCAEPSLKMTCFSSASVSLRAARMCYVGF
jgi:hypothetical protein